jgi:hypothetical protein
MASEKQRLANQQNAQKSTGPKTAEGKEKARRNALQHGMTGAGTVLMRSDDRRLRRELKAWREHLQPIDVLEDALVMRAALANVRMRRCVKHDLAGLSRRKRRALKRWDARQQRNLGRCLDLFEIEPAQAVRELELTSLGCVWMIEQWKELGKTIDRCGSWDDEQAVLAVRLRGNGSETKLRLAILAVLPEPDAGEADSFFEQTSSDLGREARLHAQPKGLPDAAVARATLIDIVEDELARLVPLSKRLWEEQDAPERQEAEDISLVDTSPEGARSLRYETANEMSLHRNVNQLVRLRKIESEQQTYDRLSKMGIDRGRRWDGTGWVYFGPEREANNPEEPRNSVGETDIADVSSACVDVIATEAVSDEAVFDGLDALQTEPDVAEQPLRNEANFSDAKSVEETGCDKREPGSPSANGTVPEVAEPVRSAGGAEVGSSRPDVRQRIASERPRNEPKMPEAKPYQKASYDEFPVGSLAGHGAGGSRPAAGRRRRRR